MARTMTVTMLDEARENLRIIENNPTNSMHYMRYETHPDTRLKALLAAWSVFGSNGIEAQDGSVPNRLAALIKRLRHLRRQARMGSRHYDLCEHQNLARDMRVMRRRVSCVNRIFYQSSLPTRPERQTREPLPLKLNAPERSEQAQTIDWARIPIHQMRPS